MDLDSPVADNCRGCRYACALRRIRRTMEDFPMSFERCRRRVAVHVALLLGIAAAMEALAAGRPS
jgi:hypothetical protein